MTDPLFMPSTGERLPGTVGCEFGQSRLYFLDPDGNPQELDARDYPFSERVIWAPYSHWDVLYDGDTWWQKHKAGFAPHTSSGGH